jgi:hypothetical protein
VKTGYTTFEESNHGHLFPTVIVGIANDIAAEGKKEINGQIAM